MKEYRAKRNGELNLFYSLQTEVSEAGLIFLLSISPLFQPFHSIGTKDGKRTCHGSGAKQLVWQSNKDEACQNRVHHNDEYCVKL